MEQKPKAKKQKITGLMIFTGLTILFWISFSVYQALTKTTVSQVLKEQLETLEPSFNKKTLDSLKQRKTINQEDMDKVPEITKFEIESESTEEEEKAATATAVPAKETINEETTIIETEGEGE